MDLINKFAEKSIVITPAQKECGLRIDDIYDRIDIFYENHTLYLYGLNQVFPSLDRVSFNLCTS